MSPVIKVALEQKDLSNMSPDEAFNEMQNYYKNTKYPDAEYTEHLARIVVGHIGMKLKYLWLARYRIHNDIIINSICDNYINSVNNTKDRKYILEIIALIILNNQTHDSALINLKKEILLRGDYYIMVNSTSNYNRQQLAHLFYTDMPDEYKLGVVI